jgi:hypothetical protein
LLDHPHDSLSISKSPDDDIECTQSLNSGRNVISGSRAVYGRGAKHVNGKSDERPRDASHESVTSEDIDGQEESVSGVETAWIPALSRNEV